jgi:hypothetical protein
VRKKRSDIASLIRDLAAKQFPNKKFVFPELLFTPESGSGYTDDEDMSDDDAKFPVVKRNPALIKVGTIGGAAKAPTPTKLPPGVDFIHFKNPFLSFLSIFILFFPFRQFYQIEIN